MRDDKFYKGLFWGTALGLGAGALLGILFAPRKGSETRQVLKEKLNDALESGLELSAEALATIQNSEPFSTLVNGESEALTNDAQKEANKIVETARERAEELIAEANEVLTEAKAHKKTSAPPSNGMK